MNKVLWIASTVFALAPLSTFADSFKEHHGSGQIELIESTEPQLASSNEATAEEVVESSQENKERDTIAFLVDKPSLKYIIQGGKEYSTASIHGSVAIFSVNGQELKEKQDSLNDDIFATLKKEVLTSCVHEVAEIQRLGKNHVSRVLKHSDEQLLITIEQAKSLAVYDGVLNLSSTHILSCERRTDPIYPNHYSKAEHEKQKKEAFKIITVADTNNGTDNGAIATKSTGYADTILSPSPNESLLFSGVADPIGK